MELCQLDFPSFPLHYSFKCWGSFCSFGRWISEAGILLPITQGRRALCLNIFVPCCPCTPHSSCVTFSGTQYLILHNSAWHLQLCSVAADPETGHSHIIKARTHPQRALFTLIVIQIREDTVVYGCP